MAIRIVDKLSNMNRTHKKFRLLSISHREMSLVARTSYDNKNLRFHDCGMNLTSQHKTKQPHKKLLARVIMM